MRTHSIVTIFASLAIMACATTGPKPATTGSSSVLRQAEIEATGLSSAYEVVTRLRPDWLRPAGMTMTGLGGSANGKQVVVYVDGMQLGGLETLRSMTTAGIVSMEFLTATQAATQIHDSGPKVASAVIMVRTR